MSQHSSIKMISDEKEQLLASKKAELELHKGEMADLVSETKALTMQIVERFKKESSHVRSALKATLNNKYDKGVIFLSHRGEVLFVNKHITDSFDVPTRLSGACVDHALIGKTKLDINKCSKRLIEKARITGEIPTEVLVSARRKDDACTLILENGEIIGPFHGEITLLDAEPKVLADITYIIYVDKKEAIILVGDRLNNVRRGG